MNKTINVNHLGGMPVTQRTIGHMQDSYVSAIAAIAAAFGERVILTGVADNGASWGNGWVCVDGEMMPFIGGLKAEFLVIETRVGDRLYQDGVTREMYYEKVAKCGVAGTIPFNTLVRTETIAGITFALSNLITAHNQLRLDFNAHTHSWAQITGKPTIVAPLHRGKVLLGDTNGGDTIRTINFPDLGTNDYIVSPSLVSLSADWNNDNDVICTTRNYQRASFQLLLREVSNNVQNLRFDYIIFPA